MKMNLQKFAGKTNVFPVSDNQFKLGAQCLQIWKLFLRRFLME